jgi:transposase
VLSPEGTILDRLEFPNTPRGFQRLEARLTREAGDELVVEAGTYAYPLIDRFRDQGFPVAVAHPRKVRMIAENDNKNDWEDGRILADLQRLHALPKAYVPDKPTLRLRELVRARWDVGVGLTQVKNRIHSILDRNGIASPHSGTTLFSGKGLAWLQSRPTGHPIHDDLLRVRGLELAALHERQQLLQTSLAQAGQGVKDPAFGALLSTRGVDFYTALVVMAEVGDVHRFAREETFRAYAGCCKRNRISAGLDRAKGQRRAYNRYLKGALGRITEQLIREKNPIRTYYEKQLRRTRSKKKAKARARRKVCDQIYRMLKRGVACSWSRSGSAEFKRKRMEWVARKAAAAAAA